MQRFLTKRISNKLYLGKTEIQLKLYYNDFIKIVSNISKYLYMYIYIQATFLKKTRNFVILNVTVTLGR